MAREYQISRLTLALASLLLAPPAFAATLTVIVPGTCPARPHVTVTTTPTVTVTPGQPTPSSGLRVSPDGSCGGANQYTCAGDPYGGCCSQYGFCGSSDDYCGMGCQPGFGTCNSTSLYSSALSSLSLSVPLVSSSVPVAGSSSGSSASIGSSTAQVSISLPSVTLAPSSASSSSAFIAPTDPAAVDAVANSGAPLVIPIPINVGGKARRADDDSVSGLSAPRLGRLDKRVTIETYIDCYGYLTTNESQAAIYQLIDGVLYACSLPVAAAPTDSQIPFAGTLDPSLGSIETIWAVNNGTLSWRNPLFDNGVASAYRAPAGQIAGARVYNLLHGAAPSDAAVVVLPPEIVGPAPADATVPSPTLSPAPSTSSLVTVSSSMPEVLSTVATLAPVTLSPSAAVPSSSTVSLVLVTQTSTFSSLIAQTSLADSATGTPEMSYTAIVLTQTSTFSSAVVSIPVAVSSATSSSVLVEEPSTSIPLSPVSLAMSSEEPSFSSSPETSTSSPAASVISSVATSDMVLPSSSVPVVASSAVEISSSLIVDVTSSMTSSVVDESISLVLSSSAAASSPSAIATSSSEAAVGLSSSSAIAPTSSSIVPEPSSSPVEALSSSSAAAPTSSSVVDVSSPAASSSSAALPVSLASSVLLSSTPAPSSNPVSIPSSQAASSAASSVSAPQPTGGAVTCPASNGTIFTSPCGSTYQVQCDVDYAGGDLSNNLIYVDSFAQCIAACDARTGCDDVAFNSAPQNAPCYLKGVVGTQVSSPGVWTGLQLSYGGAACQAQSSSSSSVVSSTTIGMVTPSPSSSLSSSSVILSTSTSSTSTACTPSPSSERGLVAFNDMMGDYQTWIGPCSTVSWYYNYASQPFAQFTGTQLQYVPMLFGNDPINFTSIVLDLVSQGYNVSHVLGFNEPDQPFIYGGSNLDPATAATAWKQNIQPLAARGIKLGAPAISYNVTWLTEFFQLCTGCTVDFIPFHWYGPIYSPVQGGGFYDRYYQLAATFPGAIFWVTEWADSFAPLATTQQNYQALARFMESQADIERHSYFGSFRSDVSNVGYNATMLDQCGRLTDIGDMYLNMTLQGNVPHDYSCGYVPPASSSSSSAAFSFASSNAITASSTVVPPSTAVSSSVTSSSGPAMSSSAASSSIPTTSSDLAYSSSTFSSSSVPSSVVSGSSATSASPSVSCLPAYAGNPDCNANAGANDQTYVSSAGAEFQISCGYNFAGSDMPSPNGLQTDSFASCMDSCALRSGCAGGVWVPGYPHGPCYLKSAIGTLQPVGSTNAMGAILLNNASCPGYTTGPYPSVAVISSSASSSTITSSSSIIPLTSSSVPVSSPAAVSSAGSPTTSAVSFTECYPSITQLLHLPTPTPLDNCVQNSDASSHNDDVVDFEAPFPLTLYSTTSTHVSVTTNGLLALGSSQSPAFAGNYLPAVNIAPLSAAIFWYDLGIQDLDQGIWYYANSSTLMIEFRLTDPVMNVAPYLYYQFMAVYQASTPGIISYYYYALDASSSGGVGVEIGIQASTTGPAVNFGALSASKVQNGQFITCNTNVAPNGTCTLGTFSA